MLPKGLRKILAFTALASVLPAAVHVRPASSLVFSLIVATIGLSGGGSRRPPMG